MPSRNTQRLATIVAGCSLFAFGVNLGSWFSRRPFCELTPLVPSNLQQGSDHPPLKTGSHPENDSPALHSNSIVQPAGPGSVHPACAAYPHLDSDVVIVVKTGATEAFGKLPTQLLTFLSCNPDDVLIFSDMEQEIGGFHIYDALADVVAAAKVNTSDFDLYEEQKEIKRLGEDVTSLMDKAPSAWALDKYKNLHTAQKAWELKPNKSWYFFIDADTYIVWSSFFPWLKRLDPAKKLYLGAAIPNKPAGFAHGGSGYALSRGAMTEIVGEDAQKIASDFDIGASHTCCGDAELAKWLFQKKVPVTNSYPLINGEKPRRMPFGPTHWCQPIITMHHMSSEETNDMWQFENTRKRPDQPLLLEELFTGHISPKFAAQREDWDNMSSDVNLEARDADEGAAEPHKARTTPKASARLWKDDVKSDAYKSLDDCARACREEKKCFQYLFDGRSCKLSTRSFKLGGMRAPDGEARFVSGWELERIRAFGNENVCAEPLYKSHSQ